MRITRVAQNHGCPVRTLILISIPWPVMAVAAVLRDSRAVCDVHIQYVVVRCDRGSVKTNSFLWGSLV